MIEYFMEQNATNIKLNIDDTKKATSPQVSCITVPASSLFSVIKRRKGIDKEKKKKYNKIWIKNNPEKRKIVNKRYRIKNADKVKKSHKNWTENNRDYPNKYYAKNKIRLNEYNKKYYKTYLQNHPEKKEEKQFSSKKFKLKIKISFLEYKNMIEKQNNLCIICNKSETSIAKSGVTKTLAIDHCHKTGKIRDLLCSKCNVGLGNFNDDIELIKKAILYLEKHQ